MRKTAPMLLLTCMLVQVAFAQTRPPVDPATREATDRAVTQLTMTTELLWLRQSLGEIDANVRDSEMRAAIQRARTSAGEPLEALQAQRNQAVERFVGAVGSHIGSARWPADLPAATYQARAYAQLQALARDWPTVRASGASVGPFLIPVFEIIGWTQGRNDGALWVDGLDQDVERAVKTAFTNLVENPSSVAGSMGTLTPIPVAGSPGAAPGSMGTVTPVPLAAGVEENIDRPGGDFRNFDLPIADPLACGTQCTLDTRCRAWTFVRPGVQGPSARCWLKDRVPNPVRSANTVSGVKAGASGPSAGGVTAGGTVTSRGPLGPGGAVIPGGAVPGAGAIPAGFGPWQRGMDIFDGADYRNFPLATPDSAQCLAECARDPRCAAVTYTVPGTYGARSAACWLKARTGRFGPHVNAMSAVKLGASTASSPAPPRPPSPSPSSSPTTAGCNANLLGYWWLRNDPIYFFYVVSANTWQSREVGYGDAAKRDWWGGFQCVGNNTWEFRTDTGAPFKLFQRLTLRSDGNLHNDATNQIYERR